MNIEFPMLTMVLLHFIVLFYLAKIRADGIQKNKIHPQKFATRDDVSKFVGNSSTSDNFQNLFEMPIVFYVLSLMLIVSKNANNFLSFVAWGYVLSRYLHSFIHCSYNKVMHRFYAFMLSNIFLIIYFIGIVKTFF